MGLYRRDIGSVSRTSAVRNEMKRGDANFSSRSFRIDEQPALRVANSQPSNPPTLSGSGNFLSIPFCVPSVLAFIHSSVEGNEKKGNKKSGETEGGGGEISCASAGSEIEIRGRSQGIRTHRICPIRRGLKKKQTW